MKAHLRMENYMVLESQDFKMEMFMKANTKMAKKTEKEFISFLMAESTKVRRKKEGRMG